MKNIFKIGLLLTLTCLLLLGCSAKTGNGAKSDSNNNDDDEKTQKITIAYHPHYAGIAPVLTAKERGYFEDENLDVELKEFTDGPSELAAMSSGDVNFGFLGPSPVIMKQGVVLTPYFYSLENDILVKKDSGIKGMEDLKGMKVGITDGTAYELMLDLALEKAGMDRSGVETVDLDEAGKATAFLSDQVDAISVSSPYSDEIIKRADGNATSLATPEEFLPDFRFLDSWVGDTKFVEENEDTTIRFLKGLLRGLNYQLDHEEKTIDMVTDYLDVDRDESEKQIKRVEFLSPDEIYDAASDQSVFEWYDTLMKGNIDSGISDLDFVPSKDYVNIDLFKKAYDSLEGDNLLK